MNEFELVNPEEIEAKAPNKPTFWTTIGSGLETVIISSLVAIFLWIFIVSPNKVNGTSMEPNLHDQSFVIMSRVTFWFREPRRGDVVIFQRTEIKDYIKRIIALPGERIMIDNCKVYVNGSELNENEYLTPDVCTQGQNFLIDGVEYIVPEGKYFVIGDNRTGSTDSRAFGPVEKNLIRGQAIVEIDTTYKPGIYSIKKINY